MSSDVNKRLGETLRLARVAKRLTQQQVADELKVTRQAVNAWESGKQWPQARHAITLQDVLGVNVPIEPTMQPKPVAMRPSLASGVRYACMAMSETMTRLLREATEAEEAAERAAEEAAIANAQALIPPAAATTRASGTQSRRQRRG